VNAIVRIINQGPGPIIVIEGTAGDIVTTALAEGAENLFCTPVKVGTYRIFSTLPSDEDTENAVLNHAAARAFDRGDIEAAVAKAPLMLGFEPAQPDGVVTMWGGPERVSTDGEGSDL